MFPINVTVQPWWLLWEDTGLKIPISTPPLLNLSLHTSLSSLNWGGYNTLFFSSSVLLRRLPRLTPLNRNDIDPSSPFCQSRFVPFPAEQTIKKRKYRARGGTCHAQAPAGIPGAARPRTPGRSPKRPRAPGTERGWREAAQRERHFGLGARCRLAQPRARVTSPRERAAVAVAACG